MHTTNSMRRRVTSTLALAASAALTAVTLSAVPATAAPEGTPAGADAADFDQPGGFYDTRGLPTGAAGDVLRSEPTHLPLTMSVPGLDPLPSPLPAHAARLIYQTADVENRPVATSAALYDSTAPWTGPGPRPTVVLGPGTQGQADACAPSRHLESGLGTNPRTGGPVISYEEGFSLALAAQGFRVMTIDYIGLGTPGIHTYADRVETAHAMLDGARAAISHTGDADSPIVFWGHSQGGGAAAAAAELAPEYAPDVDLRAAYASAPPADLLEVLNHIDGSALTGAIGFAINGMTDRYPELREVVDRRVNPAGRVALDELANSCLADIRGTYGNQTTDTWTASGQPLGEIIRNEPAALQILDHQRIGNRAPEVPVMLAGGINDDIIPIGQVEQLGRDWCAQGTEVRFHHETTPAIPSVTHAAAAVTNFPLAVEFIHDRLAGLPAPNDCGTF